MLTLLYVYLFAVLVQIKVLPIYRFYVGLSEILFVIIVCLFGIKYALAKKLRSRGPHPGRRLNLPIAGLIVLSLISYGANLNRLDIEGTLTLFMKWASAWCMFFVFKDTFRNAGASEVRRARNIILIISCVMGILSYINSLMPLETAGIFKSIFSEEKLKILEAEGVGRYFLPLMGINTFAAVLLLPLFLSLSFLILEKGKGRIRGNRRRLSYLLLTGIFTHFVILTYTRSAVAGFLAGVMVVMSFGGFRKKVLNIFIIGAIGVFLFAVVGDLFIPYFKGRGDAAYAPIVVQGSEMEIYFGSNILGRLYIHELAIRKFVNSPLFGYGFGAQLEGALMNFGHAHNSYLSALYNLGVFGFITYLIILVRIIRVVNLKIRERDQVDEVTCFMIGFLSWFVSLLVMSLFESVLFSFYEIIVVLVFMLGIIANVPSNEVAKEDGRRFLGNDIVLGGLQTRSVK